MRKWVLLLLLCSSIGALLVVRLDPATLEPFRNTFLTLVLAITTFSVTFAMAGYNASAYKQFHQGVPPRLVWAGVSLLLLALVPLVTLVLCPALYIPACLLLLPTLSIAGAGMMELTRRETDPLTLLERLGSMSKIRSHLHRLVPLIDAKIAETKALQLTQPNDRPSHEFDWHLPVPTQREDAFNDLATLGLLVMQQGDLYAFSRIIARALDDIETFAPEKTDASEYAIRSELRAHVFDSIRRLMLALQKGRETVSLCRVAIDALAELITRKAKQQKQTQDVTFSAIRLMETLSRHCYDSDSPSEIRIPVTMARQIVQKGMDDPPRHSRDDKQPDYLMMYDFYLPQLANPLGRIGSYAIEKGDAALLYLCLEAFGWLGCSAVKHQHIRVATACLRALCHLGREARAKGLECHWDKCALRPEDHAAERIGWIVSWMPKLPDGDREHWLNLADGAYSRLFGRITRTKFEQDADGKWTVRQEVSKEKHVEGYALRGGSRSVDYSDFTFLKDLELHGIGGIVMQGPLMPLFPAESEPE